MTKKNYEIGREAFWRAKLLDRFNCVGEHVARDVMAAEAAGVEWDEEEVELPSRLTGSGAPGVWNSDDGWALDLSMAFDCQDYMRPKEIALLDAMVAIYNAWGPAGELRARLLEFRGILERGARHVGHSDVPSILGAFDQVLAEPWKKE